MTGSSTKLSWRRSFPAASPFFAGAMLALLFPGVSAIRECMSSAAPEAVVLASGDERFDTAVSQSLYPLPVPSWLVEVSNADEVAAVIQCADEEGVKVCARTGGHSFTGRGQCTGVMVDLVKMKSFSFDADNNEITVGGGNTVSIPQNHLTKVHTKLVVFDVLTSFPVHMFYTTCTLNVL